MAIETMVYGANGHMGQILCQRIEASKDMHLAAKVSHSGGEGILKTPEEYKGSLDIVIDFSNHQATEPLLSFCESASVPVVIATTGQTEEELARIRNASEKIPVFFSANMSLGIALLTKLVRETAAKFPGSDIEVVEIHHNRKLDAPSGTAIMLAETAKEARPDSEIITGRSGHHKREQNEIGISSVRMGNIVGTHEVFFSTGTQTISIRHEAHDRALFADGAMDAARYLLGHPSGLYNMDDLVG